MLEICCSQTSYFQTGGHPHDARPRPVASQPQSITHCYIDVTLDDLAFAVLSNRTNGNFLASQESNA